VVSLLACWLGLSVTAGRTDDAVREKPGKTSNWTQYGGANRDYISRETGLLRQWPENGPKLLWRMKGLKGPGKGDSYGSPVVADGALYVSGVKEFFAIDCRDGSVRWRIPGFHSHSTPAIDQGRLYLHDDGRGSTTVACFDAADGKEVWKYHDPELAKKPYGKPSVRYGYGCVSSLLVDEKSVYWCPGKIGTTVVALDKTTGKLRWTWPGFEDGPSYVSPILVKRGNLRILVWRTVLTVVGLSADTGELLWSDAFGDKDRMTTEGDCGSSSPVCDDGLVFLSNGMRVVAGIQADRRGQRAASCGSVCYSLSADGKGAKRLWASPDLGSAYSPIIALEGKLYGCDGGGAGGPVLSRSLRCLEARTGKILDEIKLPAPLFMAYADGLLFGCAEQLRGPGHVYLIETRPGLKITGKAMFPPVDADDDPAESERGCIYSHPVISGGVMYLRHFDELFAFHVAGK
jgi:outer membrane protein assembly factor BamB